MRVLLLNPPKLFGKNMLTDPIMIRCCGTHYKAPYLWPPIGLAYIAGYLKGHADVGVMDAQAEDFSVEETVQKCENCNLVLVNTSTPTVRRDVELCRKIRSEGVKTGLIGSYASEFHDELILEHGVDFVVRDEPERVIVNLIENFKTHNLGKVRGLTWKKNGKTFVNKAEKPIDDLDSLPFAARELLPNEKYYDIVSKRNPITFAITSRGCPYECTFCPSSYAKYRVRSAENVFKEMEIVEKQGFRDVMFFDDTFTIGRKRVLELCSLLKTLNISWRCLSRVDTVDKEMLERMYDSGCYQIHFGVESGDQGMLNRMKKGVNIEQIERAFKWCDEIGIETVGYFMLGYPGENENTIRKTLDLIKRVNPDFLTFNIFTPLPGSKIFKKVDLKGENLENFDLFSASFCDMDIGEIQRIIMNAYRNYYFNPSYLIRRIRKMKDLYSFYRFVGQGLKFISDRRGILWKSIR